MNNDLIFMTFDNETDAAKARGTLEIMRSSRFLGVSDAVVIVVDSVGKVVVHPQRELPSRLHDPSSQVPRHLVNAISGKLSEEGMQNLVDAGLDERFVRNVSSALVPTSSAILNYVRYDSLVDTQQVLNVLNQLKGKVHCTTVPEEVERAILTQAANESGKKKT
jgi:uncharacterized membrane protein